LNCSNDIFTLEKVKSKITMRSTTHPFLQFLAHLEKRKLLRRNLNLFTGFGVPAGIPSVFFDEKRTNAPNFNSIPFCQCVNYLIEKQGQDFFSFRFGQVV